MTQQEELELLAQLQDPIHHIEQVQGVMTLEPFQKRVIQSVAKYERTVVRACHDVGKTFTASKVVLWFTSTFPGAKVITTAPTYKQVKMLLWSEIRTGFSQSKFPLGGRMSLTAWQIKDDWFAIGITSKPEAGGSSGEQGQASGFQGFHGKHILVIFDEATGINSSIWTQMEGLMTSASVKFLGIGNPTTKACEFFKCFSDPAYHKLQLTCFDSPNFQANHIFNKVDLAREYQRVKALPQEEQERALNQYKVVNFHLITLRWVMRMVLKLGMDHPLVVSKCFGEFPENDVHALIPLGVIEEAQRRTYQPKREDRLAVGVDVARFGTDQSVITVLHGLQMTDKRTFLKQDTTAIAGAVTEIILKDPNITNIQVAVDTTGVGSGVFDLLNQNRREKIIPERVALIECQFGSKPGGKPGTRAQEELEKKYLNLKSRIFVELARDLKEGGLCLLEEDIFLEELPTIHFQLDSKGRYVIESKEEYSKRTKRGSPDHSDSLALANYARYDVLGVGNFTQDLKQKRKTTIVNYTKEGAQW